jgi:hypothetical protein
LKNRLRGVYQALCALRMRMRAAEHGGVDPDRISFTVQLARLKVAGQAAADAITLDTACREVMTEILAALLPARRNR